MEKKEKYKISEMPAYNQLNEEVVNGIEFMITRVDYNPYLCVNG